MFELSVPTDPWPRPRAQDPPPRDLVDYAAGFHGLVWLVAGLWAITGRTTFEWATGPKKDYWLVRTVGGLLASTGGALVLAAARRTVSPTLSALAAAQAAHLVLIDLVYVSRRRISPVYLLDALLHLGLIAFWGIGWGRRAGAER